MSPDELMQGARQWRYLQNHIRRAIRESKDAEALSAAAVAKRAAANIARGRRAIAPSIEWLELMAGDAVAERRGARARPRYKFR